MNDAKTNATGRFRTYRFLAGTSVVRGGADQVLHLSSVLWFSDIHAASPRAAIGCIANLSDLRRTQCASLPAARGESATGASMLSPVHEQLGHPKK